MKNNWDFIIGGLASLVAMAAIIIKLYIDGTTPSNVVGTIKDLSGVLVSVLVFFVAVKSILRLSPKETFSTVLERELEDWVARNTPMISIDTRFTDGVRYFMQSDHDNVFKVGERPTEEVVGQKGVFVQLPKSFGANERILFFLNKSTFLKRAKAKDSSADTEIDILIHKIANCISAKFSRELFEASGDEKHNQIVVSIKRSLSSPDDARELVKMLDYVEMLYMAAA